MSTSSDSETQFGRVVENEKPRTCELTGTSSRSPVDRESSYIGVHSESLGTPMAGMRGTSSQAMQQLWDSVSRASALAERMMESSCFFLFLGD